MGELFTALAGTFIASVIILAISFPILFPHSFGSPVEFLFDHPKLIGWMSLGSTVLYWTIQLYCRYELFQYFTPSSDSYLSNQEQLQIQILLYKIIAFIIFVFASAIAFFVFAIVVSWLNTPDNIPELICNLLKCLLIGIMLGTSLGLASKYTTEMIKTLTSYQNIFFNIFC